MPILNPTRFYQPRGAFDPALVASYTGPGEVTGWTTGQYAFYGLQALTAAKIGSACIDVCSNIGGAASGLTTINLASNGYVDVAAVSGLGFTNTYVDKIYDQVGTQHLSPVGNRCELKLSQVGGLPSMQFSPGATEYDSASNASPAQSQPLTMAGTVRFDTFSSGAPCVFSAGNANYRPLFETASNLVKQTFGGAEPTFTNVDGSYQAYISVANGASSSMSVNGTITTAGSNPGSNGIPNTDKLIMGGPFAGLSNFGGHVFCIFIISGAVGSTDQASMTAKLRSIGTGY